jgi:hypothetical protein
MRCENHPHWIENYNCDNFYSRPECHVVSKAFSITKNTAAVDILLLKFSVAWSASLIHWSVVLWSAEKQNWLAFSKFLSSSCFWSVLKVSFQIDCHWWTRGWSDVNFGSLPGFGRVMIFASFQGARKWSSRRQWLNKFDKCTRRSS